MDGYRLLLYCSVAGAIILAASRAIIIFAKIFPLYTMVRPRWDQVADVPYLGTFLLCLPLSYLSAKLLNLRVDANKIRESEVENRGDLLMRLLQRALNEERMVSITLETRKWYAGYVFEAPNLRPSENYFSLIPVLSGYRDKDTLEARRTLAYNHLFESGEMDPEDLVIILPIESVRTANLFDPKLYDDHFSSEKNKGAEQGQDTF